MKTSCIAHPAKEPLIILRAWQVKACDGNHCAAALLSFFEHGHNAKLAHQRQAIHANKVAESHGDIGGQDVTLLQWYNQEELEEGLLHLYERKTITKAIELLVTKGFISLHSNPNPRYHFDHTRYFLFHPEKCAQVIETLDHPKMDHRPSVNGSSSSILGSSSSKNGSTISEISPEISPEIPSPLPLGESPPPPRRASRKCPKDFEPSAATRAWAQKNHPSVDFEDALDAMRCHTYTRSIIDWDDALKNWVRNEIKFRRNGRASPAAYDLTAWEQAHEGTDHARQ